MKTNTLLLLICFFCFTNKTNAQNTFPVLSMDVSTITVANDSIGGLPILTDSTIFNAVMHISLFDTTIVDELDVTLSTAANGGSSFQHTFSWDVSGGAPPSYSRSGYNITLNLGDFTGLMNYDASLTVKRTDNSSTDLVTFSR